MNLDWRSIRPLNGGHDKGFEEFCSQLARAEVEGRARFIRKGNPDAGVECFAIFPNGSEWAWQAKFFFTLGTSQWKQIDRSVRSALASHPRLERYVVCLPMDLPDARVEGQQSARAKWDAHVGKWTGWATGREMTVEFTYWGSSELLERLSRPEQSGRVRFWFDATAFDDGWFARRLDEAVRTAGPRYTPEVHVDLPIAGRFEAFGRTARFFDQTISQIRGLANTWASTCSHGPSRLGKEWDAEVEAGISAVENDTIVQAGKVSIGKGIQEIVAAGSAMEVQPSGTLPFNSVAEKVATIEAAVDVIVQRLTTRQEEHRVISQYRHQFETFTGTLRKVRDELMEAQRWGSASVMIVRGQAGTGKTHLMCDIASRRLREYSPTVLLLGQSFTSEAAPWPQAAALLDENDRSAADFVQALECAAQAAGVRALVLIDAINEGKGFSLWTTHLPAFLEHFARSDWIGVVLSIRSSYDELIPDAIREDAVVVTHRGFGERSYDALRTFFTHYGLELPSTPLMAPEFSNPLFLKTLCLGLHGQGEARLQKGIHGISAIFDLYISSVDERVASNLGLPPWKKTAQQALRTFSEAFPTPLQRWLTVEQAEQLLSGLLPSRSYEESLYRALIVEGVLVQEASRAAQGTTGRESVFIAYDRLADHLVTETLLDAHFDPANASAAFEPGAGLSEVAQGGYETQGILEALCVQLPERTGREVPDLAPVLAEAEGFEGAFTQSLVWRDVGTISERTCDLVRARLRPARQDRYGILRALLTVTAMPEHPLNARFLDARLRQDTMPERDAWWSTHLHYTTTGGGPAERLRDWAHAVSPTMQLDHELVDLCGKTLGWMLATSHRTVRNGATIALVNLLTGRLEATTRLVEAFSDVDDPYVTERIIAVAYGVATRSHDPTEVGVLAQCVYARVFAMGSPPASILLRDYARGVVERAIYLESQIKVDVTRIRPPYDITPPVFPSERDVEPLLPSPEHNPHRREGGDWARSQIGHSVLKGPLHRAIRETWGCSGEWLSLGLDAPEWEEPTEQQKGTIDRTSAPVFDRSQIERYVLQRVFELGWTEERFGSFDRGWDIDGIGRPAKESIGRKYQWIAYREVLALIADHFQYREYPADVRRDHRYVGPWQNWLRDIDPTLTGAIPRGRRRTYRQGNPGAWWTSGRYDRWEESDGLGDWVRRHEDLPRIEDLLMLRNPEAETTWLNGNSHIEWEQEPPVGRELFEVERGEVACWITAYLTRGEDAQAFSDWASAQSFVNPGDGDVADVYDVFVGEHGWAPAASYNQFPRDRLFEHLRPSRNAPVRLEAVATKYPFRQGGRDESVSADEWLQLPSYNIVKAGELRWSGQFADFLDTEGNMVAFDPSAHASGPSTLLLREEFVREFLNRQGLAMVWTVAYLKSVRFLDPAPGFPLLRISGAYRLSETGPVGFMRPELFWRKRQPWDV